MIVLLTTDYADPVASEALRAAVDAAGIVPDLKGDAYNDYGHMLNEWHVAKVPCLVKVHDGKAVDAITEADWLHGKKAATVKGRFTTAANASDKAKADDAKARADAAKAERAEFIKALAAEIKALA